MDPYTLALLAGHSDFSTRKRYVHPQADTVRAAIERARQAKSSARIGQSEKAVTPDASGGSAVKRFNLNEVDGAPGMTRTCDLLVRSQTLYPTELRAPTGETLLI